MCLFLHQELYYSHLETFSNPVSAIFHQYNKLGELLCCYYISKVSLIQGGAWRRN